MEKFIQPDYVFEVSWEVCNKVGGIYTVLSSRAKTMQRFNNDHVIFIGPDHRPAATEFIEDKNALPAWTAAIEAAALPARIGRWQVPGHPIAILTDYNYLQSRKNDIYAHAWETAQVDSLHAYGDYDEASLFSMAAAYVVEVILKACIPMSAHVVYQAHEWMSGLGMLYVRHFMPQVATIFTTHATSIGRSIVSNGKQLYKWFDGYDGDQMARELHMESKHSVEKQSALYADCFTTVSGITARECGQLLQKSPDCITPNGFENDLILRGAMKKRRRQTVRSRLFKVMSALTGETLPSDTVVISTSGRNDFRCKGFDLFIDSVFALNERLLAEHYAGAPVLVLIAVPCWVKGARADLARRLKSKRKTPFSTALPQPFITHDLNNFDQDQITSTLRRHGVSNTPDNPVKVLFAPCYFDGADGIFNLPYYDMLSASDLCVYPSYYEPWGYTPLESAASAIATVTTDLAGFGLWAEEQGCGNALDKGICVMHRDDDNYDRAMVELRDRMFDFATNYTPVERAHLGTAAAQIARAAAWSKFFIYYKRAYTIAFQNADKRRA